jgi:hypothetical protein
VFSLWIFRRTGVGGGVELLLHLRTVTMLMFNSVLLP